jgi:Tfp pilus assembly protein PilF
MRWIGWACGGALLVAGCSGIEIVRVPPGESVLIALALPGEAVPTPTPPPAPLAAVLTGGQEASDSYALGAFCLQQNQIPEAIRALERAVKIDPTFAEAWRELAVAYERAGDEKQALAAYRKFKLASAGR